MALRATLRGEGHADRLRLDRLRLDRLRLDRLRLDRLRLDRLRLDRLRLDRLFLRRQKERFFPLAQLQLDSRRQVEDRFFLHGLPDNRCLR